MINAGQAITVDWPAERYHADTETLSRSELWMLHKDPPRYFATVVERSMDWPVSKDMELGTLVHLAVLEPDRFMATVRVGPERPSGHRSAGQFASAKAFGVFKGYGPKMESLDRFKADGGRVITVAEAARVTGIAHAVRSNEFASDLLALPGANEQTILWREPSSGFLCRVRLDGLRQLPDGGRVIFDLKSTNDPEPAIFSRSIYKFGYDFQAAFYTDATQALYPDDEIIFAIIAAGTKLPFKVSAAPMADRAIAEGRRKYRAALADLVERRETNNWRAPWEEARDLVFDMPDWAYKK